MPGPLAGLRVLELARILAGPWAGQILADLGADVVKVERKGTGDDTRGWGPPFVEAADGGHLGAAYFHATNRGKRSIELDFESEDGRRIVRKLAARSDVLIENFKVGGLAKFGLDYASLSKDNPRLIYCSVTGFGQTGPYAARAGYDLMAQGMGGIMDLTGLAGRRAAAHRRAGRGYLHRRLFRGRNSRCAHRARAQPAAAASWTRRSSTARSACSPTRRSTFSSPARCPSASAMPIPNIVPYQVFPVADGHIIIATGNDNQFAKLCAALGAAEIPDHPSYRANSDRLQNRDELVARLSALTAQVVARRSPGQARIGAGSGRTDQSARPGFR